MDTIYKSVDIRLTIATAFDDSISGTVMTEKYATFVNMYITVMKHKPDITTIGTFLLKT